MMRGRRRTRWADDKPKTFPQALSFPPTALIGADFTHPRLGQHESCRISVVRAFFSASPAGVGLSEARTAPIGTDWLCPRHFRGKSCGIRYIYRKKKIAPLILLSFLCRVFYVERLFKRAHEQELKKERYNVNIQRL